MTIYNFIYCFFNKFGEDKVPTYGRYVGSLYVVFAIMIHVFLLSKIIEVISGNSFINLSGFDVIIKHKRAYLYLTMAIWLICWLYFNIKRTDLLLKKYDKLYEESGNKSTVKVIVFLVIPLVSFITLMVL